jgi:RimJ/RimL family protein N-acetyltransferase
VRGAVIETSRLILRSLTEADVEPFFDIHQDPEVMRYLVLGTQAGGVTQAWRSIAMMLGHWQLRGYGPWAIVERATGEVIGRTGLWNPAGWPGLEIGWVIRRSRWGQGFATEAARAALEWTWRELDVNEVVSIIHPDNTRSIRVAEKIGARFDRAESMFGTDVHIYTIDRPPSALRETS